MIATRYEQFDVQVSLFRDGPIAVYRKGTLIQLGTVEYSTQRDTMLFRVVLDLAEPDWPVFTEIEITELRTVLRDLKSWRGEAGE